MQSHTQNAMQEAAKVVYRSLQHVQRTAQRGGMGMGQAGNESWRLDHESVTKVAMAQAAVVSPARPHAEGMTHATTPGPWQSQAGGGGSSLRWRQQQQRYRRCHTLPSPASPAGSSRRL